MPMTGYDEEAEKIGLVRHRVLIEGRTRYLFLFVFMRLTLAVLIGGVATAASAAGGTGSVRDFR